MLISVRIEGTQPLAGTAATEGSQPLRFDGWLELLRVMAELVAAAPLDLGDTGAAEEPGQGTRQAAAGGQPESPAGD